MTRTSIVNILKTILLRNYNITIQGEYFRVEDRRENRVSFYNYTDVLHMDIRGDLLLMEAMEEGEKYMRAYYIQERK